MHRILVEEKRWIAETRFLHALNYCMLLPGHAWRVARHLGSASNCGRGRDFPFQSGNVTVLAASSLASIALYLAGVR
jgi:chromate transport protein ChrA